MTPRSRRSPWTLAASLIVLLLSLPAAARSPADVAWVEAENADNRPAAAVITPMGAADRLSAGAALNVSLDAAAVAAQASPLTLGWSLSTTSAGRRTVWARVGFENVASPFSWRIGDGPWRTVQVNRREAPDDERRLSFDVVELAFWAPIAWVPLGEADLPAGNHRLEIRLDRRNDAKGQAERWLFLADAFAIAPGDWRPHHHFPPTDLSWRSSEAEAAGRKVFQLPEPPADGRRSGLRLDGTWEYAPWDEEGDISEEQRIAPTASLPDLSRLPWYAIQVPGARDAQLPRFAHNHRFLYRTRVQVPAAAAGRSATLRLQAVNFIATAFVNGTQAGSLDIPLGRLECDVSRLLRPGQVNEIVIAVKSPFYAMAPADDGSGMRYAYYLPLSLFAQNQGVTFRFDYPVKGTHGLTGLADSVELELGGAVLTDAIAIRTLVRDRALEADATVRNSSAAPVAVTIEASVIEGALPPGRSRGRPDGPRAEEPLTTTTGGRTVLTFPRQDLGTLDAGASHTIALRQAWDSPTLWWPDAPHLYELETRILAGNRVIDVRRTRFGFREWAVDGARWTLNGIPWQLRADLQHYDPPPGDVDLTAIRDDWRRNGQTMFRLRYNWPWAGLSQREFADWADEAGIPVRFNLATFDGQHASYRMVEGADNDRRARRTLFDNWNRQWLNQLEAHRNHPSIFLWELDNEIVYINSRNLGWARWVEPEFTRAWERLRQLDPTRSMVVAGGNALVDRSLPTYGVHYIETADRDYPDEAYGLPRAIERAGRDNWHIWPLGWDRPIFMSETAFLPGRQPADFAAVGGETAFLGRAETQPAAARYTRMISEGYRWSGVGGFHFWLASDTTAGGHYVSWQPVAVLCREWNRTWAAGARVPRTLKVFNDTRSADPIEASWELRSRDRRIAGESRTFSIPPGSTAEWTVTVPVPASAPDGTAAEFVLTARRGGKGVFRDVQAIRILATDAGPTPKVRPGTIAVFDPDGAARTRLLARKVPFTPVDDLSRLPDGFRVLIIGRNALSSAQSTDPMWMRLALEGRRIVVIEQDHPLHFQAVPADFELTSHTGRVAFSEDLSHPVFAGLTQEDFFTWGPDHVVYRNPYRKASRGARSLAHADDELSCSVLAQCTPEDGLLLLSQFVIGARLATEPVAARLFDNLVAYACDYAPVRRRTLAAIDTSTPTGAALAGLGLQWEPAADALDAIRRAPGQIVLAEATPATLARLAGARDALQSFNASGGWLVLFGLSPDGLADFNRIVGVNHLLRPFRQEKVNFPAVRDPLTAGLTQRDVVMYSGQRLYGHAADLFYADDAFTHIVDLDDIAPFATWPGPDVFGDPDIRGPGDDRWPLNMVNGIEGAESWKYVFSIHLANGDPHRWDITLPREELLTGFSIAPNTIYHQVTRVRLVFDGDEAGAVVLDLADREGRQDFSFPARHARRLTIDLAAWNPRGRSDVIGVDNIWIRVARPEDFKERVRPLLNIGGLVRYPAGKGGILLNQLAFRSAEAVPENAQKKKNVTATLLRNLGATFSGAKAIVAGANLDYAPISLDSVANLYLQSAQGFPGNDGDLSAFPLGDQVLGGVRYLIRDFRTSPLESAVTLEGAGLRAGREVRGIAVGRRADALFFLHTFLRRNEWRPRNERDQAPAAFRYVVRFADGSTADVPVQLGLGVDHWLSTDPKGLRDAALAWTGPAGPRGRTPAQVFAFQWTNPRPDLAIESIDLVYGDRGPHWGSPVLLGISAASRR